MAEYDAAVRPAQNSSLPLSVKFGVSLHHIIDVVSLAFELECFTFFYNEIRSWNTKSLS